MGTVQNILDYDPHFCPTFGQTVSYVPEGVAALSEPAFCCLQADKIINDGILGFHMFYDPETQQSGLTRQLNTWKILLKYNKQPKSFVRLADLKPTTPAVFFLRAADPKWDRKLVNWNEIRGAGFTCVGSMSGLEKLVADGQ
jgi:hypothetical protein